MKTARSFALFVVAVAAVSLAGSAFSETEVAPARVGFVDVPRVFEETGRSAEIDRLGIEEQASLNQMLRDRYLKLEKKKADLDTLVEGTPEYLAKKREIELFGLTLKYDERAGRMALQQNAAKRLNLAYRQIREQAENHARRNGLDAVFTVSDREVEPRSPDQFSMLVASRPTLYWNPAYDITDALVASMKEKKKE